MLKILKLKKSIGMIVKNTKDTTKQVGGVYRAVTNLGGTGYKSLFDIVFAAVKLIVKISTFILKKIFEIPDSITKIINYISNIPENIKNKIKGNIYLYITAKDLSFFYNDAYPCIRNFLYDSTKLSEGDTWNTLMNSLKSRRKLMNIIFNKSDLEHIRSMNKNYNTLKKIEFTKSLIDMGNISNVDIYFGTSKEVISFVDIHGNEHKTNYYNGLLSLVRELGEYKSTLEAIRNKIGRKIQDTENNNNFNELSQVTQRKITDTIIMTSKIINIIGNLIRYILIDMNTIEKNVIKLTKKRKIKPEDSAIKTSSDINIKHIPKENKDV